MFEDVVDIVQANVRSFKRVAGFPKKLGEDFYAAAFARFAYWVSVGWVGLFFPLYLLSAGFSFLEVGVLVSALVFPRIFTNGPFGVLTDFKSPKRVALAGIAASSICLLVLSHSAFSPAPAPFQTILIVSLALGFALSVAETALNSLVYKRVSSARRGRDVGFAEFSKFFGIAVAYVLGGAVFSVAGYPAGFAFFAALLAALFVACLALVRGDRFAVAEKFYWRSFATREIVLLFAVMLLVSFHFGVENAAMSVYANRVIGLNYFGVSAFFFLGITSYSIFNYLAGKRLDRAGKHKSVFLVGLALSAFGFAAFGFSNTFFVALAFRIIHEFGDALVLVYALYSLSRIGGASRVGGLQGVYFTLTTVGSAVGSFSAGVIAASVGGNAGLAASFVVAAALTLCGGALLFLVNSGSLFSRKQL